MSTESDFGSTAGPATAVGSDTDRLAEDLAALRADVGRLTDSVAQLVRGQAEAGADRLKEGLSSARETLGDTAQSFVRAGEGLAHDAQARLRSLGDDLEDSIHRSPLTAVVAAAALGMVLGLMHRR